MLNIYTVTFFGHRVINDFPKVEDLLEKHIRNLLQENQYVDFLVGKNGDFDRCVSSAVLRVRKSVGDENSSLILVLPYYTAEYMKNKDYFERYYSEIEISHKASMSHPKSAIQIRNREMVDRADLIICCVEHDCGGAYKAVEYAKSQGKAIINLADNNHSPIEL